MRAVPEPVQKDHQCSQSTNRTIVLLKVPVWLICLLPLINLCYHTVNGALGSDPTHSISSKTGEETIFLLILSIAITPARRLIPGLSWLIRIRRLVGLFAFFYAFLHLVAYTALDAHFRLAKMGVDIIERPYILVGATAWCLLLALAMTSTTWSIRTLGGKRWKALHRLVYVAAILGILHSWWAVKPGSLKPLKFTIALAVVLLARLFVACIQRAPQKDDLLVRV